MLAEENKDNYILIGKQERKAMIQRLKYKCSFSLQKKWNVTSKINLETEEKSGLEKNSLTNVHKTAVDWEGITAFTRKHVRNWSK